MSIEKEIAKLNIFYSIFESIKSSGFEGLTFNLKIQLLPENTLSKFYNIQNDDSDYTYFSSLYNLPDKYTLELADISGNFGINEQKEWFKNYIKTPNKFVLYTLKSYLNKLSMNSALKNRLDSEFLDCIYSVEGVENFNSKVEESNSTKFNKLLSNKEFQDLVFITMCETIYNPEIEKDISSNYMVSNPLFWNRLYELYETVFLPKFGRSDIITDGFFNNEIVSKDIKNYGFEIMERALLNEVYPEYASKFRYYLNLTTDKDRQAEYEEYEKFRKKEFSLYLELCDKYKIVPKREKMI